LPGLNLFYQKSEIIMPNMVVPRGVAIPCTGLANYQKHVVFYYSPKLQQGVQLVFFPLFFGSMNFAPFIIELFERLLFW
jgi:hypothetical protein